MLQVLELLLHIVEAILDIHLVVFLLFDIDTNLISIFLGFGVQARADLSAIVSILFEMKLD